MKFITNPSLEDRDFYEEVSTAKKLLPKIIKANAGKCFRVDGISYLDEGKTLLSGPQIKDHPLFSDGYRYCIGLFGQSETNGGVFLGHIYPGKEKYDTGNRVIGHDNTHIDISREDISENLIEWRKTGVKSVGLFGGRIWHDTEGSGYLDSLSLLEEISRTHFKGFQVFGGPTIGNQTMYHANNDQALFLDKRKAELYTPSTAFPIPLRIKDVKKMVGKLLCR